MPSALSDKFLRYCQQSAKTQYHSIKVGAIYCLLSPESYYYRPKEFHSKLEKSMKVGKLYDVCRRLNEYMLYCPFVHPSMEVYCLLLFQHPTTKAERENIDNCEKAILATLKYRHPQHWKWPGLLEQSRLHPSRTEWVRGVKEEEVASVIKLARDSHKFGPCLFVYDDKETNVPEQWYRFRRGLIDQKKEELKKTEPERKRKREELQNFTKYTTTEYKTTAADRAAKPVR